ncbi:hypothetical protein K8B73_26190 (plasmid) [Escherichia coli]|uniref:hypothetical protein n=1 Tax=Escherichia coli TaxID=562 RepID=UPI001CA88DC8|nr:hypothetical protein [Escherichia coli]UAD16427.1 hypothetical protein K8B73_26190 [Escherichia coli]
MIFNRNKKRDEQHNSAVVLPSAENVFSDFIKNNPALTTNAFTAIGEVDCFTKVPLLSNNESEFLGILSRNIIREVQNITCDFVLKSYDETVLAVIQFGETATVRQQKKKLIIQRVCAMTGISFFEFKNTVDMMGSEDFCQFLRDDEE